MKDPTPFTDFCNAVCAQVRFRPDRAAIQTELLDHLQDHADALKERGVPILDAREEAVAAVGRSGILPGGPADYAVSGEIAVCLPRPEAVGWWLGEAEVEETAPEAGTAIEETPEPGGVRYYGLTRLGWALTFRQQPEGALFETIYYVAVDLYTGEILAIDMAG